jgi:hypothetical protein
MSPPIVDVDAQRARWRRHRETLGMVEGTGDDFGLEGLGRHVDSLDVRMVVLPADPEADVVSLDGSALDWLKQDRQTPYGGPRPRWGHRIRATSGALVLYDQHRDDGGWDRYVACTATVASNSLSGGSRWRAKARESSRFDRA